MPAAAVGVLAAPAPVGVVLAAAVGVPGVAAPTFFLAGDFLSALAAFAASFNQLGFRLGLAGNLKIRREIIVIFQIFGFN